MHHGSRLLLCILGLDDTEDVSVGPRQVPLEQLVCSDLSIFVSIRLSFHCVEVDLCFLQDELGLLLWYNRLIDCKRLSATCHLI